MPLGNNGDEADGLLVEEELPVVSGVIVVSAGEPLDAGGIRTSLRSDRIAVFSASVRSASVMVAFGCNGDEDGIVVDDGAMEVRVEVAALVLG